MLSVIMLSVIMQRVALKLILLIVIMLNVTLQNVVMLSVVMLNVVASKNRYNSDPLMTATIFASIFWGNVMRFFIYYNVAQEKFADRPINVLIIVDQGPIL